MISKRDTEIAGIQIPVYSLNTVIVGSGAAGLNCAARLFREMEELGVGTPADEIAVVTEGIGHGTSNNSGSDKQTYYKLGTHGSEPDSAIDFAGTLTAAGCAHGDLALLEGENSLRCFHHLVDIGVPFPHTSSGSFVGYKTDHDPRQRATSAGPWTSRYMVQKLLAELRRYGVAIFSHCHVLAVITQPNSGTASGVLCVDSRLQDSENGGLVLFNCRNVVMAGGGPGDLYEISVYPKGQMGPFAALLEAGATAGNLTESQFGLASLDPRWNLSGTYQQVVPRYYSTGSTGGDTQEFLNPWFDSMSTLATDIFLKGYQWPFDHDKIAHAGSSLIDVIVQNEMINRGRRVFMDFTTNPVATDGLEKFSLEALRPEALEYLRKSGALHETPIQRLAHMNQPSIDLYKQMGVDLCKEPLEIGVCSQHCNGGFLVNRWWESNISNLFVIGEIAGTHGVKRPGGSALNSGQVGGLRVAQRIAHVYYDEPLSIEEFAHIARNTVQKTTVQMRQIREASSSANDCTEMKKRIQRRMSEYAGMVRRLDLVREALDSAWREWREIEKQGLRQPTPGYVDAVSVRELALAQLAFLEAIRATLERGGGSRGSHLVCAHEGRLPHPNLGDEWRFIPENQSLRQVIVAITYDTPSGEFRVTTDVPRELPGGDFWFENTWTEYRNGAIFRMNEKDNPRGCGSL